MLSGKKSLKFSRCYGDSADVRNVFSGGLEKGSRWLQLLVSMAGCWCSGVQCRVAELAVPGVSQTGSKEEEPVQRHCAFPWCCSHFVPRGVPTSTATPHGCTGCSSCQLRCLVCRSGPDYTACSTLGFFLSQEMMRYLSGTYVVLIFINLYFLDGFSSHGAFIRPDDRGEETV